MKKALLFHTFVFLSVFGYSQFKPGDIGFSENEYKINKKAGIKTRSEYMIDAGSGMPELKTAIHEYSPEGWLYRITYSEVLEGSDMNEDGIIDTIKDEFTFYPDGRVRIIALYGYDLFPIENYFTYDKKGKLISSGMSGAEPREFTYEYDKKGRITKRNGQAYQFMYDDEGNFMDSMQLVDHESTYYVWNDKDQLVTETFFMLGLFYYRIDYSYNEAGLLSGYKVYYDNAEGAEPIYVNTYTYNDQGLLVKMVTDEGIDFRLEFRYEYTYYE